MQYIILIGDELLTINSLKSIDHYGSTRSHTNDDGRHWVIFDDEYVYYDFESEMSNGYYTKKELRKILSEIPFAKPRTVTMGYNSRERMMQVLKQDNFLRGIYVDDDAWNILPIEEFIECLDAMAAAGILDDFPPIRRLL